MWKWLTFLLAYAVAQQPQWDIVENLVGTDPCTIQQTGSDCESVPLSAVTFFANVGTGTLSVLGQNLLVGKYIVAPQGQNCGAQPTNTLPPDATPTGNRVTIIVDLAAETPASKVCFSTTGAAGSWRWTGFAVATVFGCNANQACPQNVEPAGLNLAPRDIADRRARNTCCRADGAATGTCLNPNIQACCGGLPYNPNTEKCCSYTHPVHKVAIRRLARSQEPCPCLAASDCSGNLVEQSCCLASKYAELNPVTTQTWGQCYNPAVHRCCNTGQRYDPGTAQCCAINGIQSLDTACPCSIDTDCRGGQAAPAPATGTQQIPSSPSPALTTFVCCKQTAPVPQEPERCNAYSNYPSGTGTAHVCKGQCIDSTYQICCNGAVCRREFEQCCNATCCNTYTSTCSVGLFKQGGANIAAPNFREFNLMYETCTDVEQLSTVKSFWIFILPSFLLLLTLIVFAIGLVFVHKAATREYLAIEKIQIGFAIAAIILACPLYFAPVYKYGVVTVVVAVFEILVAAAPFLRLRILGVLAMGVLLLYLFDPFHGNHYLTLASGRTLFGNPDPETAGLWYTTGKSWRNFFNVQDRADGTAVAGTYCTDWYGGYFRYDPALQDFSRFSNPNILNFGYCGRGWISTLLIVEGALLVVSAVLFLTSLLSAILPFKVAYDPIELEVRGTGSVLEYAR